MAQRSSIDRLPPEVRAQVDAAIAAGGTCNEIVELLLDLLDQGKLAEAPSRSAVGRYSQRYRALAERQREISSVAKGFAGDFGTEGDLQGRLAIQLVTSLITRVAMAEAEGEEIDLKVKELADLARALKDAVSAAKIDADGEARIRAEAREQAKKDAAAAAESTARAAGASPETIHLLKSAILGLSS